MRARVANVETYLTLLCMLASQIATSAECLHIVLGRHHFAVMDSGLDVFLLFLLRRFSRGIAINSNISVLFNAS